MPDSVEADKPLGRVVIEILPSGVLRVVAYVDGKVDSVARALPAQAGHCITLAIKEVRDAVASRVQPL